MDMDKSKSKYVGVRITDQQASVLSRLQKDSKLSKTEILLQGLDFLDEFYSLGLDKQPLREELSALENEALHHAAELKRVRNREEAIREMVQELRKVDEIVDRYHCDKSAAIQILLDIQAENHWLPRHALMWVSERLDIPMSQIMHLATFYKTFYLKPRGKHLVTVCLGTACHVRGGPRILDQAERVLGIKAGETTEDLKFTLESVNCLGCCALGPVIVVDGNYHGKMTSSKVEKAISSCT
jgi:NADH-quinone oxidoreductase subunit E